MIDQIKQLKIITAIKTPYLESGEIDLKSYDAHIEKQIASGVQGLVVGGTTGEGHLMDWSEHIMLIAHSVHKYGNKVFIIGNTGSNNTREAIHATSQGFAVGMHASLQINPYYGKTSEKGLIFHFKKILEFGPAFIYNAPGRTAQDISTNIVEAICSHKNFIGIKECAGNERIQYYEDKGIACWSGNDDEAFDAIHKHKAHGVISVFSNLFPSTMKSIATDSNFEMKEPILKIMDWLFHEPNPIPLNTAMAMTGFSLPIFRLPYVPVGVEKQTELLSLIAMLENKEVGEIKTIEEQAFQLI